MPHKKGHTWKDLAGQTASTFKKGALHIKKKWESDANPVQAVQNRKITQNIKKGTSAGKIQKTLVDAGHSKTSLRKTGSMNQDFQKMKKGGMTKAQFIKKYPNSQTAKRSKKSKFSSDWD